MNEIRSNSDKARMQKKNITPVTKGTVRKKKKTGVQKFADDFFAEDIGTIKEYIIRDIVLPTLKNTVLTVVNQSAEVALFGETVTPQKKIPGAKISYDRIGRLSEVTRRRSYSSIQRESYDYGDAIVKNKPAAQDALETLQAIIEEYDEASVADLKDVIGVTPESTDYNYGWETIATAEAVRLSDGRYLLRLPKARPLR